MKNKFNLIFLTLAFLMGCGLETIHSGHWTIKDPAQYDFDCKKAGAFEFCPTLTVGRNGTMLYVQLFDDSTMAPLPKGPELEVKISAGTVALKVLEAPQLDTLETLNGSPYATWYFAPPKKNQPVTNFELSYHGTTVAWVFSEGKKLNP